MKAYKGSRSVDPLILNLGTRWEVSSQCHALAALFAGREPCHPLIRSMGARVVVDWFGKEVVGYFCLD